MRRQVVVKVAGVALVLFAVAACGKDNPLEPGGVTCNSVGPLGAGRGTLTANVSGFGSFNGGVSVGNAIYQPVPPVPSLGIPALDIIVFTAVCGDGSQIVVGARAKTGTLNMGVDGSGNPRLDPDVNNVLVNNITFIQVVNGAAAGAWSITPAGGTGTITLNAVSTSGANGSFNVTMIPTPSTGSSGNKTVSAQFNVTF